jgi:hypothetical protein
MWRLHAAATATGVLLAELGQAAFDQGRYGIAHGPGGPAMVNVYSDLVKAHQRSKPHATGNQRLGPQTGQILDRCHATTLLVRHIGNHLDRGDLAIFQGDQGIQVTMSEMGPQCGLKPSRASTGYGNYQIHGVLLFIEGISFLKGISSFERIKANLAFLLSSRSR